MRKLFLKFSFLLSLLTACFLCCDREGSFTDEEACETFQRELPIVVKNIEDGSLDEQGSRGGQLAAAAASLSAKSACQQTQVDAQTVGLIVSVVGKGRTFAQGPGPRRRIASDVKQEVIDENKARNGGVERCEDCGTELVPPTRLSKGDKVPPNARRFDHIDPWAGSRSGHRPGDNSPDNLQLLCAECNGRKSDHDFNPDLIGK